jgi:hypothetical protein
LKPRSGFTEDRLTAALREFEGALEEGMRGIDTSVPCDPWGEIDVMALDRVNRLTIIDVDQTASDALLIRGISHVDWAVRNIGNLRRMYHGLRVNFSVPPRLFLVAPQFSPLVRTVARQITQSQVSLARVHVVDVLGGAGLFFEPVDTL